MESMQVLDIKRLFPKMPHRSRPSGKACKNKLLRKNWPITPLESNKSHATLITVIHGATPGSGDGRCEVGPPHQATRATPGGVATSYTSCDSHTNRGRSGPADASQW